MRRRRSRGPAMVSGRIRFAPSIASIRRNGTPPQWSPCRWVRMIASSELCSMPCCARAISDEVPKSIAKRELGPSTRMHVWKRPPLPKESPEPTKRTVTAIAAPRRCRPRAARSARSRRARGAARAPRRCAGRASAARARRELRIHGQLRHAGELAEPAELRVVVRAQDHVAIARREHLVRDGVRMRRAPAPRHLSREQIVEAHVVQPAHLHVEQRDIDVLAAPAGVAVAERSQDRDRSVEPAHHVVHGHADLAGRPVGFAGHPHDAAGALGHQVVARPGGVRPVLPIAVIEQYTRRGYFARSWSYARPYSARPPTLKFSISTSARVSRRRTSAAPSGLAKLIVIERLLRLALR